MIEKFSSLSFYSLSNVLYLHQYQIVTYFLVFFSNSSDWNFNNDWLTGSKQFSWKVDTISVTENDELKKSVAVTIMVNETNSYAAIVDIRDLIDF